MSTHPTAQLPAIDVSCGHLTAATTATSAVLSQAVVCRDHPAVAQLPAELHHCTTTGRLLCGKEVAALEGHAPEAILSEPWAYIDYPSVAVGKTQISFPEVARTTVFHAAQWCAQAMHAPVERCWLIVPTLWGQRRRARAVTIASTANLQVQPLRAALLLADALTSSYTRWTLVVELSARGAGIALVERHEHTVALVSTRWVLRVDPDDDVPGGGFSARILGALDQIRAAHRPTRSGSLEVVACGRGARDLVRRLDERRLLAFSVPAAAAAERAALLTPVQHQWPAGEPKRMPGTSV